ncbi:MAG: hypothetical protein GX458_19715 [Phyllobacteriaceae bacterium]|nr:hypothetical protein [Phyllobacteriaceae bacterium]
MSSQLAHAVAEMGLSDFEHHEVVDAIPALDDILTVVAAEFCAHLTALAEARIDYRGLARPMRDHWLQLLRDGIDAAYERRVMRIGLAHRDRAIDPQTYVLGYGWFAARLVEETMRRSVLDRAALADLVATLLRLIFLDLTRVVHAYGVSLLD